MVGIVRLVANQATGAGAGQQQSPLGLSFKKGRQTECAEAVADRFWNVGLATDLEAVPNLLAKLAVQKA